MTVMDLVARHTRAKIHFGPFIIQHAAISLQTMLTVISLVIKALLPVNETASSSIWCQETVTERKTEDRETGQQL